MVDMTNRVRRNPRAVVQQLAGDQGAIVLDLDTAEYFGLDSVASVLWDSLGNGGATVEQLVDRVRGAFEDCPPDVSRDVVEFVEALAARNLVTVTPETGE